jgi:transposase
MQRRYRYRFYPDLSQQAALARAFGCARVVFNDGLRLRQDAYAAGLPYIKDVDVQRAVITQAKRTPERAWLTEVSSVALVQSVNDLHRAYRNYFNDLARVKAARARGEKAKLRVRTWTCAACGAAHDRDINAARNILAAGRAVTACGPGVRPPARAAVGDEAGTTRDAAA